MSNIARGMRRRTPHYFMIIMATLSLTRGVVAYPYYTSGRLAGKRFAGAVGNHPNPIELRFEAYLPKEFKEIQGELHINPRGSALYNRAWAHFQEWTRGFIDSIEQARSESSMSNPKKAALALFTRSIRQGIQANDHVVGQNNADTALDYIIQQDQELCGSLRDIEGC